MYVSVAVVVVLAVIWFYRRRAWSSKRLPPGPKGLPLVGVTFELDTVTARHTLWRWAEQHGPVLSFSVLGVATVVISDAKLVRRAFVDPEYAAAFADRPQSFVGEYIMYGYKDVGFSMSAESSRLRKVLQKGLHLYGDGVARFERLVAAELEHQVRELSASAGSEVNPRPMVETTFCMLFALLLTGDDGMLDRGETKAVIDTYIAASNKIEDPVYDTLLQALPFLRLLPSPFRKLYLQTVTSRDNMLELLFHKQQRSYRADQRRGLVDVLLAIQNDQSNIPDPEFLLTEEQLKAMIIDIVEAGVMVTVNTVLWTLLALLHNPDCLSRIRREVDSVVGRDRCPTISDRPSMPYSEAVIFETLRYSSLLPALLPHRCSHDVLFEGYDIQKDTQILANVFYTDHDAKVWDDPWSYRPDRFLDKDGQLVGPSHPARQGLLAFGAGRRQCPGEALGKSRVLLYLESPLQQFDIQPAGPLTPFDPRTHAEVGILLEAPPFTCRFLPRQP